MLKGFEIQADKTKDKLFQMKAHYDDLKKFIRQKHPKMNAIETANHLFACPVTNPTIFSKEMKIHFQTASKHLNDLKESGILRDTMMGKKHLYYNVPLFKMIT